MKTTGKSRTRRSSRSASMHRSRFVGARKFSWMPTQPVQNSCRYASRTLQILSNSRSDAMENQAIKQIADKYRNEGFEVIERPSGEDVPSFAKEFGPVGLIANKGNEHVIIEVKEH